MTENFKLNASDGSVCHAVSALVSTQTLICLIMSRLTLERVD